jgi:hypothetical protein
LIVRVTAGALCARVFRTLYAVVAVHSGAAGAARGRRSVRLRAATLPVSTERGVLTGVAGARVLRARILVVALRILTTLGAADAGTAERLLGVRAFGGGVIAERSRTNASVIRT